MDAICLYAASDNVERMMKKVAGRMGFDRDPGQVADAAAKKDKDKAMKALTRNLAKCSHANPVIAADYLINYVSCSLLHVFTFQANALLSVCIAGIAPKLLQLSWR